MFPRHGEQAHTGQRNCPHNSFGSPSQLAKELITRAISHGHQRGNWRGGGPGPKATSALRQTSRSQAPLAAEQLALPYDLPSTSTGLQPETGAGSGPGRQVIGSLPWLSQLKPWEAAAPSAYKGPIMGGRSQEARYLQQERQQPGSIPQSQASPSSLSRHAHTMAALPAPRQPPSPHAFWDGRRQPQGAAVEHRPPAAPRSCLTCRSPDVSPEGHHIQHAPKPHIPTRWAAGSTPFCLHTDTHARRIVRARAARSPATRVGQTDGTRASTERAPALLRGPGPVPEPAEAQHSPSPPHITPCDCPGHTPGAAPGAPVGMEGGMHRDAARGSGRDLAPPP